MKHTYEIHGMTCDGCRAHVEKALSKADGVSNVSVDLEKAEAIPVALLFCLCLVVSF